MQTKHEAVKRHLHKEKATVSLVRIFPEKNRLSSIAGYFQQKCTLFPRTSQGSSF
jgi:hypothetical protein